ncbi:MAG: acetate--CoA ligase family protein, partial [Methylocystaceae bacterium]|nr:acetate--CoA ligase family protein [Methylocystaceae bacterium]
MNIHEYQAKQLLKGYGVNVLNGGVAYTAEEARAEAQKLGGPVYVVKSQIHAGGRGKGKFKEADAGEAGGVRVVKSVDEVAENAKQMLGHTLVTHQSGPEGKEVKRVYIEDGCDIRTELYLAFLIDRATSRVTIMASTEGGMDIEEVAASTPEKILTVSIDPATGIMPFHTRKVAFGLGLSGAQVKSCTKLLAAMYKAFMELDASMVEINPL